MKELILNKEEINTISRLSNFLGLNLSKEELKKVESVKKVLRQAWQKSDEKLHNWGISRMKISSLSSRIGGFNRYILRRHSSISNVLMS